MGDEQIYRLRRMGRNIGVIWCVITLGFLAASTAFAFSQQPALITQPRGWLILLLAAAFGSWFLFGQRWMAHDRPGLYHRRLMNGELGRFPPRAVIYWLVLLGLAIGLGALDKNLSFMLYAVYGTTLGILVMPWTLALTVPTVAVIFVVFGWLPQSFTVDALANFILQILFFGMYTMIVYLPFMLLGQRFQRERVYSELERSHQELAEAHRRLADAAERERELAVLRERERLARDLHDTIGHALVLASVKLEAALRLREVDSARADHEIVATQNVLRGTMAELRGTLAGLRAPELACEPLSAYLARRAREAAVRAGWQVTTALDDTLDAVTPRVYETLVRVGTEALANAEKHAAARHVTITLAREDDSAVLRITDDGAGIATSVREPVKVAVSSDADMSGLAPLPPTSSPPGHYGITGMRERVEAAAGAFAVTPGPDGRGTVVEARISVSDQ